MLAYLAAPFLLGVFWRRGGTAAAVAAMATGLVVRFGLVLPGDGTCRGMSGAASWAAESSCD